MTIAFIFPGQGSQSVGMSTAMADAFPIVTDIYKEASDALGYDLWAMVADGPAEDLNQTQNTQPAILTASYANWKVLQAECSIEPKLMAGHSLGEYSALVCAGVLGFSDAVKLVHERGQLMQEAVPAGEGAMAAILGMSDEDVIKVCKESAGSEIVSAVNFNSPGQVVIAGQKAAVERAMVAAKDAGAKRALPLPVSVPSHCALMKPAAEKLAETLKTITLNNASIPVIHNVDVAIHTDADKVREMLAAQLFSPVRWSETIVKIGLEEIDTVIECGPGKVLTGLNKRINKSLVTIPVFDPTGIAALGK